MDEREKARLGACGERVPDRPILKLQKAEEEGFHDDDGE
jgi:hypothetical protein